jgi:hypothetical protein
LNAHPAIGARAPGTGGVPGPFHSAARTIVALLAPGACSPHATIGTRPWSSASAGRTSARAGSSLQTWPPTEVHVAPSQRASAPRQLPSISSRHAISGVPSASSAAAGACALADGSMSSSPPSGSQAWPTTRTACTPNEPLNVS